MILVLQGHSFRYELENICRLFVPMETITVQETEPDAPPAQAVAVTRLEQEGDTVRLFCRLYLEDFDRTAEDVLPPKALPDENGGELRLATLLYELLCELFGASCAWGLITGVRPVKLLRRLTALYGEQAALEWMRDRLLVSDEKLALCRTTLAHEDRLLALSRDNSFSLYVSIPFCPTRCDYCSFVSQTVERAGKLIDPYVELLCEELAYTGELAARLGLRLETVYFGGGTPTTLNASQLTALTRAVAEAFDLSSVREYTVEAGRPDTVTADKLEALQRAGVTRISINPQTLEDTVLQAIGRRHTAAQFYEAFALARRAGFANINTDLIAGLPGDTAEGFSRTLDGILALRPESVTVHTLSMKRASNLVVQRRAEAAMDDRAVHMVAESARRLTEAAYHPYYLYRQSRTVGNQENVGWSLDGFDGLYNTFIMDETHSILACGAGAVTKLRRPHSDYIERIFNYKYPYEYNKNIEEMMERKRRVISFYEETEK